jgi:hypothetical protein
VAKYNGFGTDWNKLTHSIKTVILWNDINVLFLPGPSFIKRLEIEEGMEMEMSQHQLGTKSQ